MPFQFQDFNARQFVTNRMPVICNKLNKCGSSLEKVLESALIRFVAARYVTIDTTVRQILRWSQEEWVNSSCL